MNIKKAYKGIAAAQRCTENKLGRTRKENAELKRRNELLSSEDPVLADLVDQNYMLVKENDRNKQAVKNLQNHNEHMTRSVQSMRDILQRATVALDDEKKAKQFWCCSFIVLSVVEIMAFSYMFVLPYGAS